jgi:hypothetical protein
MVQILSERIVSFDFREALGLTGQGDIRGILAETALNLLCLRYRYYLGDDELIWTEVKVGDSGYLVLLHDVPDPPEPEPELEENETAAESPEPQKVEGLVCGRCATAQLEETASGYLCRVCGHRMPRQEESVE